MSLAISHADDLERHIAESLGGRIGDLRSLDIGAVHIVIECESSFVLVIVEGYHYAVFSDLKHVLRLIRALVGFIRLRLADGVSSVWQIVRESLGSVRFLLFVPVDCDLAYVLACRYSLDRSAVKEFLLGFELLPVDSICLVVEVASDDYIPAGYVLDGHDDAVKVSPAESFRLNELLISLDDLHSTADDFFSYLVLRQVNDDTVFSDPESSGPFSIQEISLGRLRFLYEI